MKLVTGTVISFDRRHGLGSVKLDDTRIASINISDWRKITHRPDNKIRWILNKGGWNGNSREALARDTQAGDRVIGYIDDSVKHPLRLRPWNSEEQFRKVRMDLEQVLAAQERKRTGQPRPKPGRSNGSANQERINQ